MLSYTTNNFKFDADYEDYTYYRLGHSLLPINGTTTNPRLHFDNNLSDVFLYNIYDYLNISKYHPRCLLNDIKKMRYLTVPLAS